ncbi:hypothetical protein CDD83_2102 [Cordyceps sp. RAO-2017]|nr:hypothetical protein CDD83_2102 [Cordyceps sp. RAO-2017]
MAPRRRVLLISVHPLYNIGQPWFHEKYAAFHAALRSKAYLQSAQQPASALRLLAQQPPPIAVFVTDTGLALPENAHVWQAVLWYIRRGGTAVVMGLFPIFAHPYQIRAFFAVAGLDWAAASFGESTVVLYRAAVGPALALRLAPGYRHTGLSVRGFAPADAWYLHMPHEGEGLRAESPVVLVRVENGRLGYLGDVNAGPESVAVMLAMCGLL